MAPRRPLVVVGGRTAELPTGDTLPADSLPPRAEYLLIYAQSGTGTWTNMPAALTEFLAQNINRLQFNLTGYTQIRIHGRVGNTVGSTAAVLAAQYSTDNGTTWAYFDTSVNGPSAAINTTGYKTSSWLTIPLAARTDVLLRLVGSGGDGVIDPTLGTWGVQVR